MATDVNDRPRSEPGGLIADEHGRAGRAGREWPVERGRAPARVRDLQSRDSSSPGDDAPADVASGPGDSTPNAGDRRTPVPIREPDVGEKIAGFRAHRGPGPWGLRDRLSRPPGVPGGPPGRAQDLTHPSTPNRGCSPGCSTRISSRSTPIHRVQSSQVVCMPFLGTTTLKNVCTI